MKLGVWVPARFSGLLAAFKKIGDEAVLMGGKATRNMTQTDRLGRAMRIRDPEAEDRHFGRVCEAGGYADE